MQEESPPRGLPDQGNGIIVRKRHFAHGSNSYVIKTLSDTSAVPNKRALQCFRYEVENLSDRNIGHLFWELARINVDPLEPGTEKRRSFAYSKQTLNNPEETTTVIKLFEDTSVETRAWSEPIKQAWLTAPPQRYAEITQVSLSKINTALPQFLAAIKLPVAPVVKVDLTESGMRAYPIRYRYSGPGFNIELVSSAIRDNSSTIEISTELRTRGKAANEATYNIPALNALNKLAVLDNDIKIFDAYYRLFEDFKNFPDKNRGKWSFSKNYSAKQYGTTIYRISHPVAISIGKMKDCVLVESYSPMPLNFNLQNCRDIK